MRLLLLSNSRNPGSGWLDHAEGEIRNFLGPPRATLLFLPFAAVSMSFDNYMAMARIEGWTEDVRHVRRLSGGAVPLLGPGQSMEGVPPGAFVFLLPTGPDTPREADGGESLLRRILVDPEVFSGKPILRGMRVAVEHVLGWLAAGATVAEILEEVPELEADDVRACLVYAARTVANERILPRATA